jgi:hypothetical protein
MRKSHPILVSLLLSLCICGVLLGQSSFATIRGTVADGTGALIPGVSVTATNVETNVTAGGVSNETGTYSIPALLPGTYKVTAELPGFQTQTITDVRLGNAEQVRLNFTLTVAGVNTGIEVTVAPDTILTATSSSVGEVLSQQKVTDLPLVGNNVLDLMSVVNGINVTNDPIFGANNTTFAGIAANYLTVQRDGIMVQDTRWPTGINSATVINPDLVGEIKLILAPVDAEMGRGNGGIQIQTRSGTNQFRGSAVWSFQNTALDPNTWENNRNQPTPIVRNWSNHHQYTVSLGGPIVRNKTFFYALFDGTRTLTRAPVNSMVLTPCARNGIFRYYDNWNNGNALSATTAGNTPTTAVVDFLGNPKAPATNPDGTAHNGILRYISVFGPLLNPPTKSDCSDAVVASTPWDSNRRAADSTGFVKRLLAYMPNPNAYDLVGTDGLNTAGIRWTRKLRGRDNLFGVGEAVGSRKQVNIKIDHNFNQYHKLSVNWSHERDSADDTDMLWPNTFKGDNFRRPNVVTASFVSTLSPSLLNEARFGYRLTGSNIRAPWDVPANLEAVNQYLPPPVNGIRVFPRVGTGLVSFQVTQPLGNRGAWPSTLFDRSPSTTYADTLSWTKGKHAFKGGAEFRFISSRSTTDGPGDFGVFDNYVQIVGGDLQLSPLATTGPTAIANTNPAMTGLATVNAQRARNLLTMLAGSVASVNERFWMSNPKKLDAFDDFRNSPFQVRDLHQNEFNLFFKDDWKATKNLTLNLGVRWDVYLAPYMSSGMTAAPIGGGAALFGISGRGFESWMQPGPVAYDPNLLTQIEFVGPHSPNPHKKVYPVDWNNIGPAIGFAWQQGKTTLRGGYQVTFQGGLGARSGSTLDSVIGAPPGSSYNGQYVGDSVNTYLDLSTATQFVPVPIPIKPMQPIPITARNVAFSAFDPNTMSPYVQNMTLQITRDIDRATSIDLKYVGTLGRKGFQNLNLNIPNFIQNGLIDELQRIRTGGESPMLDEMFRGINICGATCTAGVTYGPVGSTVNGVLQTAALQMRSSSTFQTNLANGNFAAVAATLSTLNYSSAFNPGLPIIPGGVNGAVLRYSGKFPENFILTNPQFSPSTAGGVTYYTNLGHNNYHSMQAQLNRRLPWHGMSGQATYTWSKNLGLASTLTDPTDRAGDYTIVGGNRAHEFRTNVIFELPIGPNKLLLGRSSGALARAIEGWKISWIYNASTGPLASIQAQNMLYGNGVPDIVAPFPFDTRKVRWGVPTATGQLNGSYFDPNQFVTVPDPQCATVTPLQNLNGLNPTTGLPVARCTLDALAAIVPAGTPGSFVLSDGRSARIVLQNPQPGKRGTLGQNVIELPGTWRFDASISKTFKMSETKSFQLRIDCTNVLNHPVPGNPNLNINLANTANPTPFGGITTKTGTRSFQGQMRLNF